MPKTLKDFDLQNKRVLVRCDFNVPLDEEGNILDDFRIKKTIPTIEYLIKNKAKVILISHLGRPTESSKFKKYSLKPIALKLEELLEQEVHPVKSPLKRGARSLSEQFNRVKFLDDCIGEKVEKEIDKMQSGDVVLLENLRFHKEEEENDSAFAKDLAKLAEIYINEAFSVCHRNHASVVSLPKYLPSGMGILLEKEIEILTDLVKAPKRPFLVIIGGKKIETKIKFIQKSLKIADWVLVGGLLRREIEGKKISFENQQKIVFPKDVITGELNGELKVKDFEKLDSGEEIYDIGPQTQRIFKEKIALSKTVFWNGPLGMFEEDKFSKGSRFIVEEILKSGAFCVAGGGETIEFLNKFNLASKFNYICTGGGAMLAFLSGEKLPGIEALH